MIEPPLLIGGDVRTGRPRSEVVDPATGAVFATVAEASLADLDDAFAMAAAAQPAWAARTHAERVAVLAALAERVQEHGAELAELITREQGKPLASAAGEVRTVVRWIAELSELDLSPEVRTTAEGRVVEIRHDPIGVVAAITPWNVPLGLASWKIVPALLAGNAIVLKPSPFTPLATTRLGEIAAEVLPPGLLTVITGGDALGAAMVRHPVPGKVTLTGSVATGLRVAQAAAEGLKRVTLELGGNDAAIVLDDVDVDAVAARLFATAFANAGQICTAVKRVYAHRAIAAPLAQALAEHARAVRVGAGLDPDSQLGPLATTAQRDRVEELVEDARRSGGRILVGGHRLEGAGNFYAPTIIADLPPGTALEREEQFGPVLPVFAVEDAEEAIARANAVEQGLGASVWTADRDRALAVERRLEAGTVWVNEHLVLSPTLPFGGHKRSGLGVENGREGLLEYTRVRVVHRPA